MPGYQRREAPGRVRYHTSSATTATVTTAAAAQNASASSGWDWCHVTPPTAANAAATTSHETRSSNCGREMRSIGGITSAQCSGLPAVTAVRR